jgi:hypothetical protein
VADIKSCREETIKMIAFQSSRTLLQGSAILTKTRLWRSKRLSRKDRGGFVVPGATEKLWVSLVNEMSTELCRMRRDAKTFSVQEKLLRRSDDFFAEQSLQQQQQQAPQQNREDSVQHALREAQALLVDAVSFHLRAVVGSDAAVAERQLQRISRRVMKLIAASSNLNGSLHVSNSAEADQCAGLLLVSASFLCRGIREWELLHHDEVLEVASTDELRRWETRLRSVCKRSASDNRNSCFWSHEGEEHIGRQHRWLLTLPIATVSTASNFKPHRWNNRLSIVALTNVLAMLHDTPYSTTGKYSRSDSLQQMVDAVVHDLHLFPVNDGWVPPLSMQHCPGQRSSSLPMRDSEGTVALPRWALGILVPFFGSTSLLRTYWWPAHAASVPLSASTRASEGPNSLANTVKLFSMMNAVKTVTIAGGGVPSSLSPFNCQNSRKNANKVGGGVVTSKQAPQHIANGMGTQAAVISVNAAMRRVYTPTKALDNTLVEVSALTHDLIASIPFMSSVECHDFLLGLHDRSFRSCGKNTTGKHLLEASLRVLLLRYVRLVDKAVERGSSRQHQLTALQRQSVDEELSRFHEVYQCTSSILLRWNIADENIPPAYWSAVKQYLD